jgi:hypothetical protein
VGKINDFSVVIPAISSSRNEKKKKIRIERILEQKNCCRKNDPIYQLVWDLFMNGWKIK